MELRIEITSNYGVIIVRTEAVVEAISQAEMSKCLILSRPPVQEVPILSCSMPVLRR
jgi:hypothetical protein